MTMIFLKLLNMSIAAGWLILAVILLRFLLKRLPKLFHCILWIIVGVRLICPFSLESALSLIPSAKTVPDEVITEHSFRIDTGVAVIDTQVNEYLGDAYYEDVTVSDGSGERWIQIMGSIWLVGVIGMLGYSVISYGMLRRKVKTAIPIGTAGNSIIQKNAEYVTERLWICDDIGSPFILGVIRPRIYVPSHMEGKYLDYVLAHEHAHLKRGDQFWKPFAFLLLSIYWFHPLVWAAYILLCRDIELACDEQVVKNMELSEKKEYSKALLSCSISRHMIAACPVAFGEVGVKERIRSVLNYKKPAFWIIVVGVVVCLVVALCFLTNPKEETLPPPEVGEGDFPEENMAQPAENVPGSMENEETIFTSDILTEPPMMQVVYEDKTVEVASANWQWSFANESGEMTSKNASGAHPLESSYDDSGAYIYVEQNKELHPAELLFSVMPDSIEVTNYWPSSKMWFLEGNETGLQYSVSVEFADINRIALRDDDSYVYEIKAVWDREEYQGEATYSFQTRLRSITPERAVASVPSMEIYEFQLVDGSTGEKKSFSMLDSSNGYRDLLNYYEKLSFVDDDSLSERSGYSYFMKICDVDGNILQTVIAYKDAVSVDGKIYRCVDDSGTNLMLFMDLLFHPAALIAETENAMDTSKETQGINGADGTYGTDDADEADDTIGVSMAFSELSADGGTLTLTNSTGKDLTFGEDYKLYVWKDGDWQEYPVKDDQEYAFDMLGIILNAGKTVDWKVDWSIMHGTLPKGRYKIEKSILEVFAPGDIKEYYVSCQFIIQPMQDVSASGL